MRPCHQVFSDTPGSQGLLMEELARPPSLERRQWAMNVGSDQYCPRPRSGPCMRPTGLLWVVEQIPGYVRSEDITRLLELGYFSSYNVPFFKVRLPSAARQSSCDRRARSRSGTNQTPATGGAAFRSLLPPSCSLPPLLASPPPQMQGALDTAALAAPRPSCPAPPGCV